MFCGQRLKYIALFLLVAFIIFGCGKDPDDPILDNPFDPKNPKTNGEPYHLQVAVGDKNVVNLKWNQIDKVKKFSVYRSTSLDNEYKMIGISTSTEYVDSNIDANVTYNYKIRAYWNGTEASPSGIVSIMPLIIYTITATAESGGSISPSGNVKVANGLSQAFNISPNVGYSILDVKVDGVSKGNISSYIFSNVTTDHTIKASFSTNTFTITATAENGGNISPSGNIKVAHGLSQTFSISPNTGYSILDVKVDGVSKGNISSYTFSNVTTDHTIKASFSINTFTITATAESGGSISPSGNIKVTYGSSQTFNISPNAGYSILDVKLDGVSKGNISSYTFSNVITDHTIKASFSINTFTITATTENGGNISPSGNIKVNYGSSQSFNISPNARYSTLDVQIDGKSIGKMDRYTFDNIITNHQIKAIFEMIPKIPDITGKDGAPMVLIPAGEFQMGDSLMVMSYEKPVHTVYLDAFYMDVYEVTNAQYKKFMDATGYKAPTYWNDPNIQMHQISQ